MQLHAQVIDIVVVYTLQDKQADIINSKNEVITHLYIVPR